MTYFRRGGDEVVCDSCLRDDEFDLVLLGTASQGGRPFMVIHWSQRENWCWDVRYSMSEMTCPRCGADANRHVPVDERKLDPAFATVAEADAWATENAPTAHRQQPSWANRQREEIARALAYPD